MLPLPPSGLPAGWSLEQWEAYGHEYYEMNANKAQAETPQYPRFGEAVEEVKINSAVANLAIKQETIIINFQNKVKNVYWVVILLSGMISVATLALGLLLQAHHFFSLPHYRSWPDRYLLIGAILGIVSLFLFIIVHKLSKKWKKNALNRSRVAWRTGGHSTAVGILKARVINYNSDLEFASELEMILSQVEGNVRF